MKPFPRMGTPKKITLIICVFIVTCVPVVIGTLHAEQDTAAVLQKAENLYNQKKYSEALGLYEKLISTDPNVTQGYRGIVRCYSGLGDPQGAAVYMETLFLENPDSAGVYYGLGYALYNLKQYEKAKDYFEKAVALDPNLAPAWNNCAAIYHFIIRDYGKARTCYEKAIAISKKTGDTRVLEIAQKNLENLPVPEEDLDPIKEPLALEEFINRFIAGVEQNAEREIKRLVLGQQNNCSLAMQWFLQQAMGANAAGNKDAEGTTLLLAKLLEKEYRTYFKSNDLRTQLVVYENLDDKKKKHIFEGEQLLNQGSRREEEGSYEEALSNYQEAAVHFEHINDKGRTGLAYMAGGDLARAIKKYPRARDAYSNGLTCFIEARDDPRKALALSSLGITYYFLGEHTDALDFLKRSLKIYRTLQDEEAAQKVEKNIELIEARIKN